MTWAQYILIFACGVIVSVGANTPYHAWGMATILALYTILRAIDYVIKQNRRTCVEIDTLRIRVEEYISIEREKANEAESRHADKLQAVQELRDSISRQQPD